MTAVYETVFRRFKQCVPEKAMILPGYYASFYEADEEGVYAKRLNDLWRENIGLQFEHEDHFIAYVLTLMPHMLELYVELKRRPVQILI